MAARDVARFALLISLATCLAFQAVPASAATCRNTVVVTDGGDSSTATPGQLRTAIAEVCSGGTVRLQPRLLVTLTQGQLTVPSGKDITMATSRAQPATIDANQTSRVIWIQIGAGLILKNVTVQNGTDAGIFSEGSLTIVGGMVTGSAGRGITNHGTAVLMRDTVVAANQGGGIANVNPDPLASPPVGGFLTLEDKTTVTGNTATSGGGILNGAVTTLNDNSSVASNTATGSGGGIVNVPSPFSDAVLILNDNASVTGNSAAFAAGIFHDFSIGPVSETVLNDQSRISNNVGTGVGGRGVLELNGESEISFNAEGVSMVRGRVALNDRSAVADNQGGGVSVGLAGSLTLNDESMIVRNGGTGVTSLEVAIALNGSSRISDNDGGGVRNTFSSTLTLNDSSTISGNTSPTNGGGVLNESATVELNDDSQVVGNIAQRGGGIYNSGPPDFPASVTLNDASRITGNTATAGQGGGVYSEPGSTVAINDSSSISGNIPDNCFPPIC